MSIQLSVENELPIIVGASRIIATIAIYFIAFIFVLDYTIVNVAIPYISGGLASSLDEGTYAITFFSAGNGIFIPMTGWLSKRFGLIRTLFIAAILFTFLSWACSTSTSIFELVVFRFLQGASAGPLIPISQTLLANMYSKKMIISVMAIYSMIIMVAPVLGPIVGGYFCVYLDWRWIFYINIPIGLICAIVIFITLKHLNKNDCRIKFDWISFILLLIGMTSLQLFFDKGEQWDWFGSNKIIICFILMVFSFCYLITWSLICNKPLFELRLLKIKNFAIATILIFFLYSLYIGGVVIVPLWLQEYLGYNAFSAGMAVAPIGIFSILFGIFVGKIVKRIGFMLPMIIGLIFISLSSIYATYFNTQVNMYSIGMSRFILGIGMSFIIIPLINMPINVLPNKSLSSGLGIFHFIRVISGGIGTSVYVTLFNRRIIQQHSNIIGNINNFNEQSVEFMNNIKTLGFKTDNAISLLDQIVEQQASAIAFNEINCIMSYIAIALCVLVLFSNKKAVS